MKKEILREIRKNLVVQNEKMNGMTCLRENLRLYIAHKEITLVKLSENAEISMETLKTIIYGKYKSCDFETVAKLAKVLCVTTDELFGIMDKQTASSLAYYQDFLPSRSKRLIDWHIKHQVHEIMKYPNEKRIPVMTPIVNEHGNLKQNHEYEYLDISNIGDELLPKAYFGIKIPCDFYMPTYVEGDILILANDRKAKEEEIAVILTRGNIAIVKRKIENGVVNYYSIRDGKFRTTETPRIEVVGYVIERLDGE